MGSVFLKAGGADECVDVPIVICDWVRSICDIPTAVSCCKGSIGNGGKARYTSSSAVFADDVAAVGGGDIAAAECGDDVPGALSGSDIPATECGGDICAAECGDDVPSTICGNDVAGPVADCGRVETEEDNDGQDGGGGKGDGLT